MVKNNLSKLLEKQNVDVPRVKSKYKHNHAAFVEAFNKELSKRLFKSMDAQVLQNLEKVSTIWVKNLDSIVNKMKNMKPEDAIKLYIIELDSSETYPEQNVLPEDGLNRYLCQPGEQHGDKTN